MEADERTEPGPEPAGGSRLLRRSRSDRVIAGVGGGLGRYFGIDPLLIRVAFVLLLFAGGVGLLAYVILWIAMPEERPGEEVGAPARTDDARLRAALGLGLVAVGVFFLLDAVFPDAFEWRYVWPVLLIALGVLVLARGGGRR